MIHASFCNNFIQNVLGSRGSAPDPADGLTALPRPQDRQLTNVGGGGGWGGGGARPQRQHSHRVIGGIIRKRLKTPGVDSVVNVHC